MKERTSSVSNFDLWLLIAQIHHLMVLIRQRELSPYHIPPQQLQVLRIIQAIGSRATLAEIAKQAERKVDVISRQAVGMEKDGLIQRIKDTPKSRLLRIELTKKGLDLINICGGSKEIDGILSFLNKEERQQLWSILSKMFIKLKEHASV